MHGIKVFSKAFGEGTVIQKTNGYITVRFAVGEKEFPFPRAFDGFLFTEDPMLLAEIEAIKRAVAEEKARLEEEARRAEEARQAELALQAKLRKIAAERRDSTTKQADGSYGLEGSNLAFKLNFCDGGASEKCVGFRGSCSDQNIHYNIVRAQHVWCSNPDAPCRKYYDGWLTRKELDETYSCFESKMLYDWKCYAGVYHHGLNAGKPMKLRNVKKGRLTVMTTRDPNTAEYTRYIFGVFIIDEYYECDEQEEGYVVCHSKWRIELTPGEAHQMLFWNYYFNQNAPEKMVFGSGLHRYLSDIKAAQILRDIVKVKRDVAEKQFAQEFLEHFCETVGISIDSIPVPAGALRR